VGIDNGCQLHLVNKDASISAQILTKEPVRVETETNKIAEKDGKGNDSAPSSASTSVSKPTNNGAASSSGGAASSSGPASSSKPVQDAKSGKKVDPKFQSFDAFLRSRRYEVGGLPGSQKYISAELKQGGMIKLPPSMSVKQQPYRHVDTLSVMNIPEIHNFVSYWSNTLLENACSAWAGCMDTTLKTPITTRGAEQSWRVSMSHPKTWWARWHTQRRTSRPQWLKRLQRHWVSSA
jgi:hypothetical protein